MTNSCWNWPFGKNRKGYGLFSLNGKTTSVTRWMYKFATGKNPGKKFVCHKCDNPSCFNPDHLWLGDAYANMRDMVLKKRHYGQRKTKCKNGHSLSGDNLYVDKRGYRECKTCRRENVRNHRALYGRSDRP
jgi:hypothetical protein